MSEDSEGPDRREPESTELPPTTAAGSTEPAAADLRRELDVGHRIGPYRLLEKIGEGGMGEVWLADQTEPVQRKVALKIIKHGMDTAQVVARFDAERQALAVMDHPAVAKVFDAGSTPQGRPYFVMEYVRGIPITKHSDRNRLTLGERLELFCQLCAGVQHAHQKAIIHRDLKPSNVLVAMQDGEPVVKIIDFGIAKATAQRLTEREVHTQLGVLIGTPEYMSPEQADVTVQDVDTRTDVYSLGVMLYELLVGALPFDSKELREAGYDGIVRKIREDEPSRPSTRLSTLEGEASTESARRRRADVTSLRKRLTGDLDWITMRSLEKDRSRRYQSPADLAADVRRHLESRPVVAGPPSKVYRLKKFVARHRVGVGVAAAGALALAGFGVVLAVQAKRVVTERDRARDVRNYLADTLRGFKSRELGETLMEIMRDKSTDAIGTGRISESRMEALLTAVEPWTDDIAARLIDEHVVTPTAESIDSRFADDPVTMARLLHTVGYSYKKLSLYDRGNAFLDRALTIRKQYLGSDHQGTLNSLRELAWGHSEYAKDRPRATELFTELHELHRRKYGDKDKNTLYALIQLGNSLQLQASVETDSRRKRELFERAEAVLREAADGTERHLGKDHNHTAYAKFMLGVFLSNRGRECAVFEPLLERAIEIREAAQPGWFGVAYQILGQCRVEQGRYEDAEELYQKSLEKTRRRHDGGGLKRLKLLGDLYLQTGRVEEAVLVRSEVAATRRRSLGPEHPDTVSATAALAEVLLRAGRAEEAREQFRAVLEQKKRRAGLDGASAGEKNAYAWSMLTVEPIDLRDPAEALLFAIEANEMTDYENPDFLDTLALAWHRTGDTARAIETQEKALERLPEGADRAEFEWRMAEFRAAVEKGE